MARNRRPQGGIGGVTVAGDEPGFAKVATLAEVAEQDYSLSIPLYVRRKLTPDKPEEAKSLKEICEDWEEAGQKFRREMDAVVEIMRISHLGNRGLRFKHSSMATIACLVREIPFWYTDES